MSKFVTATIKSIRNSNDLISTVVIWAIDDGSFIRSNFRSNNKEDFWESIGADYTESSTLIGKSFKVRIYQMSNNEMWFVDPFILEDLSKKTTTNSAVQKVVTAEVVTSPKEVSNTADTVVGSKSVVAVKSPATIAGEKGRDTRALNELHTLLNRSILGDDHDERQHRLNASDPEIMKTLRLFDSLMIKRLNS